MTIQDFDPVPALIGGVLIGGLEAIEEYVTQFLPARWLAMIVPLLVLLLVLLLDPPSVLVLLRRRVNTVAVTAR